MEEHQIQELIYLVDINFQVYSKIDQKLSSQTKGSEIDLFILFANNSFNSSIEILHTLLCSTKKEEIRIEPILKEIIEREKNLDIHKNKTLKQKAEKFKKKLENDYPNIDGDYFSKEYLFLNESDNRLIGDILSDMRKIIRVEFGLKNFNELKKLFENGNFHKIRHQTVAHKNKKIQEPAGSIHLLIKNELIEKLAEIIKKLRINSYFWFDYEFKNPYSKILYDLDLMLKNYAN